MVNNRIKELIKALEMSYADFADSIGVQRSSISHIISGRNKPSLDFIQKLHLHYPNLNNNWVLFGEGQMFKTEPLNTVASPSLFPEDKTNTEETKNKHQKTNSDPLEIEPKHHDEEKKAVTHSEALEKKVIKLILLYADGSFEEFHQNK